MVTVLQSTTLARLSTCECSEVVVHNRTANNVNIYDDPTFDNTHPNPKFILLGNGDTFTFRGLTNCDQLTAVGNGGTLTYRAQYYTSMTPIAPS